MNNPEGLHSYFTRKFSLPSTSLIHLTKPHPTMILFLLPTVAFPSVFYSETIVF